MIFIKSFYKNHIVYNQGFELISIIDNEQIQNQDKINLVKINTGKNNFCRERKYFIAVASDLLIPTDFLGLSSVIPHIHLDYLTLSDQLLACKKQIEQLGSWGKGLEQEVKSLGSLLLERNNEIEKLGSLAKELELEVKSIGSILLEKNKRIEQLDSWDKSFDLKLKKTEQLLNEKIIELDKEKNKSLMMILYTKLNTFLYKAFGLKSS